MKKFIENFIYQSAYRIVVLLFPIITIPFISRALGPEGIGTWGFVVSIANFFTLAVSFSLGNYAIREIAFVKDDRNDLSNKFWEIYIFNSLLLTPILIFYIFLIILFPFKQLFIIMILSIIATSIDISWFFQGLEEFKQVALRNIIIKLLSLILIVVYINDSDDLWKYILLISGSQFASSFSLWFLISKYITWKKPNFSRISKYFNEAIPFFTLRVTEGLFSNLNKTILGIMTTMSLVGYFTNSLMIITALVTICGILNQILLPKMAHLEINKHTTRYSELLNKSLHFQLFFSIGLTFIFLTANNNVVDWFFGSDFFYIKRMLPLMSPIILLWSFQEAVNNQFLIPKNQMRASNITMIVGTFLNILLCIILIPLFRIYGIIISFIVGQAYICISRSYIMIRTSSFSFDWINLLKWLISGNATFAMTYIATKNLQPNIITTIIQITLGAFFYLVITALLKSNIIINYIYKKNEERT